MDKQDHKPTLKPHEDICPIHFTMVLPSDIGSLLPECIDWTPLPEDQAVRP